MKKHESAAYAAHEIPSRGLEQLFTSYFRTHVLILEVFLEAAELAQARRLFLIQSGSSLKAWQSSALDEELTSNKTTILISDDSHWYCATQEATIANHSN